jgi:sodium-dependent dicarboxylate transporter 2/3/5
LAFLVLSRIFPFGNLPGAETRAVADMLRDVGPMSTPEKRVALVFAVVVACWVLHPFFGDRLGIKVTDTGIAVAGAIALFLLPADWGRRTFLLDYATARKAPWEILVLFGGGLSLAAAMESSGLVAWIADGLSFLHGMPLFVLILGVALLLVFMTELMSNTAAAAAFLPVAGSFVLGADAAPLLIAVPVALAASAGYMLPVSTLPNALVYGTGYIPLPQMIRAGFVLDLLAAAVIAVGVALAAPFI